MGGILSSSHSNRVSPDLREVPEEGLISASASVFPLSADTQEAPAVWQADGGTGDGSPALS